MTNDIRLLKAIASLLDRDAQPKLIKAECERMREEFRVEFAEALTVEQMRKLLRQRQQVLAQAAETITGGGLQDYDWLPHAGGFLGPEPDADDAAEWRALVPNLSSTEIAGMLWALSEQAKFVADSLAPPDPRTSPTKEAAAIYAYMLWTKFAPRRGRARQQPKAPRVTGSYDELIVANWSRHPREFRAAYSMLRQARDSALSHRRLTVRLEDNSPLAAITVRVPKPAKLARTQPPVPLLQTDARYVRPPRGPSLVKEPSVSNDYTPLAAALHRYLTGRADEPMEWACRKVLKQLKPRRRRR